METGPKFFAIVAAIFVSCAALTSNTFADRNRASDDGMDNEQAFDVDVLMTPTAAAPAGASIEISFEAEDENGAVTSAELELKSRNLPAGTYSAAVTLKSDGSTVVLGSFTVNSEGEGEIEFGEEGTPFPANIDPLDVASVVVTDVNGVVLFTADLTSLTSVSNMNINVTAQLTAGVGVPNANGTVMLNAFLAHGKVKGSLQVTGHGLPTNASVVIAVNGVAVKTVHTSKTGDINVKLGPKGKTSTIANGITLAQITSITVTDRNGNVLLQVSL